MPGFIASLLNTQTLVKVPRLQTHRLGLLPICPESLQNYALVFRQHANSVGLSKMCYRLRKANKTCLGERQESGRMGKLL